MNQRAAPPSPSPAAPQRPAITGRDREFLPAAMEILETPAAPLPVITILTICGFFAVALAWSFYGQLDVHAVAPGKVEIAGYAKVIEPIDSGKVAAIHVEEGQSIKAGDVLLELDPAEANADLMSAGNALNSGGAEVARRRRAIAAVRAVESAEASDSSLDAVGALARTPDLGIVWEGYVPEPVRLREEAVLRADLSHLAGSLAALDKQMAQKRATRKRLEMSIAYQHALMDTLNQRVATRQQAIDLNVGTKINLYDAKEELEKSQSQLASDEGQLIEADAALKEIESEKGKAISQFIADNENKLADAARKADDARQALAKAAARLSHTRLLAPIDGMVQQLAVTTVGQVVTTGQQLAVIMPHGAELQIRALVANLDIGFVKPGQEAVIKVEAFPFTRFGVLRGKVVKIAPGAIAEQEAKRALANAAAAANVTQTQPSLPGQSETFVFPVTVALEATAMQVGTERVPLTPGMTVTVEIRTDTRRIIDYLLSPLAKLASEAGRER